MATTRAKVPNRLYETMTRVKIGDYTIRVWIRSKSKYSFGPDPRILYIRGKLLRRIQRPTHFMLTPIDIVAAIEAECAGIEAIEILDKKGNGCLVYPDWK